MKFIKRPLPLRLATGEREGNDRPDSTLTKGPVWPGAIPLYRVELGEPIPKVTLSKVCSWWTTTDLFWGCPEHPRLSLDRRNGEPWAESGAGGARTREPAPFVWMGGILLWAVWEVMLNRPCLYVPWSQCIINGPLCAWGEADSFKLEAHRWARDDGNGRVGKQWRSLEVMPLDGGPPCSPVKSQVWVPAEHQTETSLCYTHTLIDAAQGSKT